jgi:hypothetical protein
VVIIVVIILIFFFARRARASRRERLARDSVDIINPLEPFCPEYRHEMSAMVMRGMGKRRMELLGSDPYELLSVGK